MDWRSKAACLTVDPELFFPIGNTGPAIAQAAEAKRRALGVRDTLISQGILAQRIILRKPEQTTGSGNNVEARRVELLLLD